MIAPSRGATGAPPPRRASSSPSTGPRTPARSSSARSSGGPDDLRAAAPAGAGAPPAPGPRRRRDRGLRRRARARAARRHRLRGPRRRPRARAEPRRQGEPAAARRRRSARCRRVLRAAATAPGVHRLRALALARDLGAEERVDRVEAYGALLGDADCDMRRAAARRLGEIGDPAALPRLAQGCAGAGRVEGVLRQDEVRAVVRRRRGRGGRAAASRRRACPRRAPAPARAAVRNWASASTRDAPTRRRRTGRRRAKRPPRTASEEARMARKDGFSVEATGVAPLRDRGGRARAAGVRGGPPRRRRARSRARRAPRRRPARRRARAERFEGKAGPGAAAPDPRAQPRRAACSCSASAPARGAGARSRRDGFEPLRMAAGRRPRRRQGRGALARDRAPGRRRRRRARRRARRGGGGAPRRLRVPAATRPRRSAVPRLETVRVAVPAGRERAREVRDALALAARSRAPSAWARDLVNLGPADCTPDPSRRRGARARPRGRPRASRCAGHEGDRGAPDGDVPRRDARLGRAAAARHRELASPAARRAKRRPLVLVGKAITFDSGGLSLKPTESMVTMNTDMAGSAAVLGTMRVVAALRPAVPGPRRAGRLREHAGRPRLQAVRRARRVRRTDGRDHQHRRRGAARPRRRHRVGGAPLEAGGDDRTSRRSPARAWSRSG